MSVHDEIQELLPAFALGALDDAEAAQAQAHVASCAQCARTLDEYRSASTALAYTIPLAELPENLKLHTLQRATQADAKPQKRRTPVPSLPWWQRLKLTPLLAGAALVIALIALGWNTWQMTQLSQQLAAQRSFMTFLAYASGNVQVVHGTTLAPQATGRLYADPDENTAELVTINMPALDPGHVYQVWLTESNGQKISGGTFGVDAGGSGWLWVRAPQQLKTYREVGITTEPRGGSPGPTTGPVLHASIAGN